MMSPFTVLRFWNRAGSSDIEINANGCPEKSGTQVNGYKLDENVWFELITTNGTFEGLVQNANSN